MPYHTYKKLYNRNIFVVWRRQWLIGLLSLNSSESSHNDNYRTKPSKLCRRLNNIIQFTFKLNVDWYLLLVIVAFSSINLCLCQSDTFLHTATYQRIFNAAKSEGSKHLLVVILLCDVGRFIGLVWQWICTTILRHPWA